MKVYKLILLLTILLLLDSMAEGWGRRRRWRFRFRIRGRRLIRRVTNYAKAKLTAKAIALAAASMGKREVPDQAGSSKCKFSDFDENGDRGISLEEFMLKMGPPTEEQIVLFSLIDDNGDDTLDEKELNGAQEILGGCA